MTYRLLALLAALLIACGGSPPPPAPAPQAPAAAEPVAIDDPGIIDERLMPLEQLTRRLAGLELDNWYGIYMGDAKVGYARMQSRPAAEGEPGRYVFVTELMLADNNSGSVKETRIAEQMFYAGEAPYPLIEQRFTSEDSDARVSKRWVFGKDGTQLHVTLDGAEQPVRKLPATRSTIASSAEPLLAEPAELSVGQKAAYYSFDDDTDADERFDVEVAAIDKRSISGVTTQVITYQMREEKEQLVYDTLVVSGGPMLSMKVGGLEIRLEEQSVARSDVRGFNVLADAVAVDKALGEPDSVTELTLLLVGVPSTLTLPSAPNQQVTVLPDGRQRLVLKAAAGAVAAQDELAEALRESSDVDYKNPSIGKLAQQIITGVDGRRAQVEKLRRWVFDNLDKDLSTNIGTASQVLARRKGDCTEHALLLAALARSLGIPARRVSGLVYIGDFVQRFGWHEWNEIAIDGAWWPIDPSWEAPIANATHIKLGNEDEAGMLALMGKLEIVVEAQKK